MREIDHFRTQVILRMAKVAQRRGVDGIPRTEKVSMWFVVDHRATVIEIADVARFHCDVVKINSSTRLEVAIRRR